MASMTPRASGFWEDETQTNGYFPEDDADENEGLIAGGGGPSDGRTNLDKTIDRIGMGSYQWTLLSLCGFGWMADNMWIQAVAIILPRVQQNYAVPDSYIGFLSSSMFAGMMFGAIGWGTCSDLLGRSTAFNATLFFTAVFGLLASFVDSFKGLCFVLFLLGSSVGGSMPTDGTLLLEHMPNGKQYLVTALSVFFSMGAFITAVVALLIVPQHSCKAVPCNVAKDNNGWKWLLLALGLITLSMFSARMIFFRLHESPRYLVSAGRPQEALESLQMISKFNGEDLSLDLEDVEDRPNSKPIPTPSKPRAPQPDLENGTTVFDADAEDQQSPLTANYHSTHASPSAPLNADMYSYATPASESAPKLEDRQTDPAPPEPPLPTPRPRLNRRRPTLNSTRRRSSVYEKRVCLALPSWLRRPLWAWWDKMAFVLSPEWRKTTILVWIVWCTMSLGYTMFNVYLPKLLETSGNTVDDSSKSLEETLWDVVIFTLAGIPGPILGAYMVDSRIGKRWSLAGSTFVTGFFCVVFVMVESSFAVRAASVGINFSATTMWAVLYGWTPEIFTTEIRGSACGIASALSRIGGMIAPVLGGVLLMMRRSFPVYTSVVVYIVCGACVLMLKETSGGGGGGFVAH